MTATIEIPPLPVAKVRALSLVANRDPSYDEMVSMVAPDPALTTALMRAANSALSAPVDRVRTARAAIIRLGITETRRLVMGVALSTSLGDLRRSTIDEHELWRHLIATAVLADATAWGEVEITEAFTAGLLHDLGRLAMAAGDPTRYARVVKLARQGVPASEVERAVFGVDHAEWGQTLGRSWGFPAEIVDAIADHHAGTQQGISWVVTRAREIAAGLGIGDGLTDPAPMLPDSEAALFPVIEDLGGSDAVLQRIDWYQGAIASVA